MRLKCFLVVFFLFIMVINCYGQKPPVILSIDNAVAAPGQTFNVSMTISDATGLAGGDITINYDISVLEFSKLVMSNTFKSLNLAYKENKVGKIGEILIAIASPTGMKNLSGEFMIFTFKVLPNAPLGRETQIEFKKADLYDAALNSIPVKTQDGTGKVKVGYTCVAGDVNNDGKIDSRDAILALRFAAEIAEPTPIEICAADVNNDGAIKSNDAIKILRMAVGLNAPSKEINITENGKLNAKLDKIYNATTKNIIAIIKLNNIDTVAGGDIRIAYDSSILRVVDISSDSNVLLASNIKEPGIIKLSFANTDKLINNDVIQIRFESVSDNLSLIALQKAVIYSFDGQILNKSNEIERLATSWGKIKAR